ncbi:hypothetical protein BDZ89DRAFT_1011715 [Hymenopellis radicata]|nr:hypothetical protein BDZ89DRAFT_1011715 [Hymenopellis radicata]
MSTHSIKIEFSLHESVVPGTAEYNLFRRMRFWEDSARPWLLERGYTLYTHPVLDEEVTHFAYGLPLLPNATQFGGAFPYAFHDDALGKDSSEDPYLNMTWGRVVFAQDKQHRHVALKLVRRDSEESRILFFLLKAQDERPDRCIRGVLPLLDMLSFGGHWLAVMPRWGEDIWLPWFGSIREVLVMVHSLLAALAFLHGARIAHRDIALRNILFNHIPLDLMSTLRFNDPAPFRLAMRRDDHAKYGLYDFNLSLMFPNNNAPLNSASYRLPTRGGWFASVKCPPELFQGEYDYNPFAFDVGCLGIELCDLFQHLTPTVPMLAPLLDGMTTWDIDARLTAEQALQLFESLYPQVDELILTERPRKLDNNGPAPPYDDYDRWSQLSPEFVREWSHFRTPKLPVMRRVLRWVCRYTFGAALVRSVRRLVDSLVGSSRYFADSVLRLYTITPIQRR